MAVEVQQAQPGARIGRDGVVGGDRAAPGLVRIFQQDAGAPGAANHVVGDQVVDEAHLRRLQVDHAVAGIAEKPAVANAEARDIAGVDTTAEPECRAAAADHAGEGQSFDVRIGVVLDREVDGTARLVVAVDDGVGRVQMAARAAGGVAALDRDADAAWIGRIDAAKLVADDVRALHNLDRIDGAVGLTFVHADGVDQFRPRYRRRSHRHAGRGEQQAEANKDIRKRRNMTRHSLGTCRLIRRRMPVAATVSALVQARFSFPASGRPDP
ncbi:MAG: hypothetical protein IPH76_05745 [Xanthomonadales bacterium]|nr:hypothetical protein [Xanthomonadales bacterium]